MPVAVDADLPAADVDDVLGSERYAAEVADDITRARELGISGVPFFVLGGRLRRLGRAEHRRPRGRPVTGVRRS